MQSLQPIYSCVQNVFFNFRYFTQCRALCRVRRIIIVGFFCIFICVVVWLGWICCCFCIPCKTTTNICEYCLWLYELCLYFGPHWNCALSAELGYAECLFTRKVSESKGERERERTNLLYRICCWPNYCQRLHWPYRFPSHRPSYRPPTAQATLNEISVI